MQAKLRQEDKIEIVRSCGEKCKSGAADLFINRHPERNIQYETVQKVVNKFRTYGDEGDKFSNKHQKSDDEMKFDLTLSAIEHSKYTTIWKSGICQAKYTFKHF